MFQPYVLWNDYNRYYSLLSNTGFYVQITKFENNTGNLLNVFVTVVKQDDRQDTTIVFILRITVK